MLSVNVVITSEVVEWDQVGWERREQRGDSELTKEWPDDEEVRELEKEERQSQCVEDV